MTLELHPGETGQITAAPPRDGVNLNAWLAAHSGDVALMLLIATAITIGHWRYWFYPDNLTLPDGSPSPLAGTLNLKRVIGDFLFMPTGIVSGILVLGFSLSLALACAVVVFVVFVGSAFLMSTFEKARDGALGVAMCFLASLLPGRRR
jgi:disulfide bond formation protein DsbB